MMRIGHGFDVHAFGSGDHVMLGGEKIAHSAGLVAHSDGDVVLHALCDALLGAAGLGDIGGHFPDTDTAYAGADSRVLLRQVVTLLHSHQWQPVNVDITIIAQKPKLAPHSEAMRANIASDLGIKAKAHHTIDFGFLNCSKTTLQDRDKFHHEDI